MRPNYPVDRHFRQCVGIDISKDKFTACMGMLSWGCPFESTPAIDFSNNKNGFNQLVKWARKEAVKDHPILFLMEATGIYYEDLAYHLNKLSFTVYVIHPARVHAFFKEEGIKTKTDAVDSKGLSLMGCCKPYLKSWIPPSPLYRELRQLTRFGVQLKNIRTMLSNRKEALVNSYEPSKKTLKEIESLIRSIDTKIAANDSAIRELANSDHEIMEKVRYIESIKGIGFLTAITILAETDGFAMFTGRRQVASFAGLDVVPHDSGKAAPQRKISKVGNAHIRRALYFCAISASMHNSEMRALYARICTRRPARVARVAVMRKLLILAFTLCKNKSFYKLTI